MVELWRGKPDSGELLASANGQKVARRCSSITTTSVILRNVTLSPGATQITVRIKSSIDRDPSNNEMVVLVYGLQPDESANQTDPRYGKIAGIVFEDLNGNRIQDNGEPGVEKVLTMVRHLGTAYEDAVLTGSDGTYEFDKLLVGAYAVAGTLPPGFASIVPELQSVSVGDGVTATADFRLYRTALWMPQINKRP